MRNNHYIVQSLELHLFFGRIMKEHALFLRAGFTPANAAFSKQAEFYKNEFEKLLYETVTLSNGIISSDVLNSGEIVTEFTALAEKQTECFTGIAINRKITDRELRLCDCCNSSYTQKICTVQSQNKRAIYNCFGDHDPEGLIFVPMEQVCDVICGRRKPVPLILRANAGDWIEVTLYNLFDPGKPIRYNDYPSVPLDFPHEPGNRVSLNPQFLKYDPIASSGINVGYNAVEQTVRPGECIKYLWHADREYGTCLLTSFGDLRNHRHHGLFGAIIIEPTEAKYYNSFSLMNKNYKEEGGHEAPDHEDTGEKGYNYHSERFFNRLKRIPLISKVFDSKVHGDPSTPIFRTYTGERVIIRLLMPSDKPRNISFTLHGHRWKAQPDDPFTRTIPIQGAISVGNVFNIEPERTECPGDYMYRSGSLRWDVEPGMWGIFRVMNRNIKCHCELAYRSARQLWNKKWYEK